MAFDAGAIEAKLTVDTSRFYADLDKAEARTKAFEDAGHKVKITAVFDQSSLTRARKMFSDLDNAVSKDAMSRLRSSPQGSVLGALNALFSPHPVTGAPSPQQAATQGLLGKMISQPGGGGPSPSAGRDSRTSPLGSVLTQGGTATQNVRQVLTGQAPGNVTTTDTINRRVVGAEPGNITTTDTIKEKIDPESKAQVIADSADSGDKSGKSFSASFLTHIRDLFSGKSSGGAGGGTGAGSLGSGLLGGIGPNILGANFLSKAGLYGGLGILGAASLPALAAGVGSLGVAGAGVGLAAAGAKSLIGTKNVAGQPATQGPAYEQAQAAGAALSAALKEAATGMLAPLQQALAAIPGLVKGIEPALKEAFAGAGTLIMPLVTSLSGLAKSVLPLLGQAFRAVAPLITPMVDGLGKLITGILPGLITLLKAAQPAVTTLFNGLGIIGRGLGQMFAAMAPAVKASSVILNGLLSVFAALLPIVGHLASIFATALAPVFDSFAAVIKSLLPFLTLIGNVFASLAQAVLGDLVSAFGALAQLLTAIGPSLKILANALSQVFNVLENSGVFAVLGDALEAIVPVLAKLINTLVSQLAPILPVIINLVSQFATILIDLLAAGLTTVLQAITWLLQKMPFLVPVIAALTAAWLAWNLVMDANPIGLIIIAIGALIGAITLLVTHWSAVWSAVSSVAVTAWQAVYNTVLAPMINWFTVSVPQAFDTSLTHVKGWWADVQNAFVTGWQAVYNNVLAPIGTFFTKTLPGWWTDAVNFLKTIFITPMEVQLSAAWTAISAGATALSNFFTVTIPGWWTDCYNAIVNTGKTIIAWFQSLPGMLLNALSSLGQSLLNWGSSVMTDMLNGFKSIWNSIVSFFESIPGDILHALDIGSPPDWAIQAGKDIMQGLGIGMNQAQAKVLSVTQQLAAAGAKAATGVAAATGAGAAQIQALMQQMAAAKGWTGAQWAALNAVEMAEAGYMLNATNPSSGAYGLAQFINGASEYAAYGGNPNTPQGQITGMLNYIAQRYGTPEAAWAHEQAFNWYGQGGTISEPVIGYGLNSGRGYMLGESGREVVIPAGRGGGDSSAALLARLDRLIEVTRQIPAGVGDQVGGALGGAASAASFRSRYPVGGA